MQNTACSTSAWWSLPRLVDLASEDASFKTVCSIGAWWIFLRPVVLTSEDHAQNRVFHR